MQEMRSRLPEPRLRERLEDRYGKIGIAAVAAAVRPVASHGAARQMAASLPPKNDDPQS